VNRRAGEPRAARRAARHLDFETVALVLQGGGALGSYQAGVVEGLAGAGIEPDWIAGISIGALNTAVIAGNPVETRMQRLREFWETICRPAAFVPPVESLQRLVDQAGPDARKVFSGFEAWRALVAGQREFFVPRGLTPWLGGKQGIAQASFYDTTQLKGTLERFVDFDRINAGPMRVLLVPEDGLKPCFASSEVTQAGRSSDEDWFLVRGRASAECAAKGDAAKAIHYDAKPR